MTTQEKLKAAWDAVIAFDLSTLAGVVVAHEFVCHNDGSECDGGAACSPDREALNMYHAAENAREEGQTFEAFAAEWTKGATS